MWFLPTHGRARLCQEALDACRDSGMTEPALLYIDGDPEGNYLGLRRPDNWQVFIRSKRLGLGAALRWFFETFPEERYYGWLADDLRPRTPGWDVALAAEAVPGRFVCCNDDWMAHNPQTRFLVQRGQDMCGALCWGGELVRTVGWWQPPFLRHDQVSADTAWCVLLHPTNRFRYRHDIVVEHLNWRTRKRERDATDRLSAQDGPERHADFSALNRWISEGEAAQTIMRLYERELAA